MGIAMFCPGEGERVDIGTVAILLDVPRAKVQENY